MPERREVKRGRPRPVVYVMARLPVAGRVKTRLARQVGVTHAVRHYRRLLAQTLRRLTRDPRFETRLAVVPMTAPSARVWERQAHGAAVIGQAPGGLGAKMSELLAMAGRSPAAVIGSDIVGVDGDRVMAVFAALRDADAALGPAEDGGFWCCAVAGIRRRFPRRGDGPFEGVAWSRCDTLAATRAALTKSGFRVGTGPLLADFDQV